MVNHVLSRGAQTLSGLAEQFEYLRAHSAFYRVKWARVPFQAVTSLGDLSRLPFTTNAELKALAPFGALCDDQIPEAYYESSGTSGIPTPGFPDLSATKASSFGRYLDQWMGLRKCQVKRAIVALAYEMNPTGIRFQMALPHAGITVIPCGVRSTLCPPEKVLGIISELSPEAIFSRPFETLRMGDALLMTGKDPAETDVSKLFVLGEPISINKWGRMRELWDDADLYAHYGLTEADAGLATCAFGFYHEPDAPHLIVEIVEKDGDAPTASGEWGEIVLTTLKRAYAPIVRYRTGDFARRLISCKCGQATSAYEIKGRVTDAHSMNGKIIYPIDLENAVLGIKDVGNESLFVIRADNGLTLVLERAHNSTRNLELIRRDVLDVVEGQLRIAAEIKVQPFGTLADKLGIAKKKGARFTDLRGLSAEEQRAELTINILDSADLRTARGIPISI